MIRILRAPHWSFSVSDGSYYGWRWWITLGPLVILMSRNNPEEIRS